MAKADDGTTEDWKWWMDDPALAEGDPNQMSPAGLGANDPEAPRAKEGTSAPTTPAASGTPTSQSTPQQYDGWVDPRSYDASGHLIGNNYSRGGGGASAPAQGLDTSMQPINAGYDALNQLLQQMWSSQQARDAENASYRGSIRGSILSRLNAVSAPKDMNSPEVAAQSKAYRTSSERNLRSQREALAERAHAQGLPSGAQDAGVASAYSGARRDQASFDASTLGQSIKDQRDELDRLLSLGAGMLSADDMASIQTHRDQLTSQLNEIGMRQAGSIGQQDINLRALLGGGSLDLQRLGLNNQDAQYWAKYGLDFGNSEWEHNYLDTLLGIR